MPQYEARLAASTKYQRPHTTTMCGLRRFDTGMKKCRLSARIAADLDTTGRNGGRSGSDCLGAASMASARLDLVHVLPTRASGRYDKDTDFSANALRRLPSFGGPFESYRTPYASQAALAAETPCSGRHGSASYRLTGSLRDRCGWTRHASDIPVAGLSILWEGFCLVCRCLRGRLSWG